MQSRTSKCFEMCRWSGNGASYTKLCDQHVRCSLIKGVVEGKPKRLIEAVAEDIASKLLQQSRDIQIVRVEVAKVSASNLNM